MWKPKVKAMSVAGFLARFGLGFVFLWGGYTKIFMGDPYKTVWGFLGSSTSGPLVGFFHSLVGNPAVVWLVAGGELLIGISLILGLFSRIGYVSGILQMIMFALAMWPIQDKPTDNPLIDVRIFYVLMFLLFFFVRPGQYFGIDGWLMKKLKGRKIVHLLG